MSFDGKLRCRAFHGDYFEIVMRRFAGNGAFQPNPCPTLAPHPAAYQNSTILQKNNNTTTTATATTTTITTISTISTAAAVQ